MSVCLRCWRVCLTKQPARRLACFSCATGHVQRTRELQRDQSGVLTSGSWNRTSSCRCMMTQGLKQYDRDVAVALLTAMYEDDADFTNTFRALSGVSTSGTDDIPDSLAEVWTCWSSQTKRRKSRATTSRPASCLSSELHVKSI